MKNWSIGRKAALLAFLPTLIVSIFLGGYFLIQRSLAWVTLTGPTLTNSNGAASYIKTETLFTTFLIVVTALLICALIARLMTLLISRPLGKINKAVQHLQNHNYDFKIQNLHGKEFKRIAKGLNQIKVKMQKLEEEQHNIACQENNDLKHTLEEIEIQNIELNIALKNALRNSKRKSDFIASLTHEIRTPMSSIIGFSNLLLESDISKYQQDYLLTIQKSAATLLAIINDILDFSKIEAGKFKLENIPFDFIDILDEVLQSLSVETQNKHIELVPLFSPNIPAKLIGDPLRVKQILTNLIFNAIKFTEEGSVCLKTELLQQTETNVSIEISVIDTGIGLSDKDKENLFKAFEQADITTARKFGGTGLGLVISKQFIEQMGGSIEIHSKLGIGTTIRFNVNFQPLNQTETHPHPIQKINSIVLVYDAHMLSRKSIKQFLLPRVETIITVDTLERMTLKLEEMQKDGKLPDKIILGLVPFELQNKKIQETITFLKNQYGIPVTVLSNTGNKATIDKIIKSGATNCIIKPISMKKLLGAINANQNYNIAEPLQLKVAEPQKNYRDCKLLVAEDNPANLKLITSLLNSINMKAETVIDGKLACEVCDEAKYSLIFLDLHMPIMGGLQAAQNIRQYSLYNQTTPIIAISAYIAEDEILKLYNAGFNELLIKPIETTTLEYVIDKWCDKTINLSSKNNTKATVEQLNNSQHNHNESLPLDLELGIQLSSGSKELALEIIQMFVKDLPDLIDKMQQFYRNKDWENLKEIIHKINGSSSYCAMLNLQKTANKFEDALNQQAEAEYTLLYKQMQQNITEVQNFVAEHVPDI